MIFNTHSHINDQFEKIDEIVQESLTYNVTNIGVVGYDLASSKKALIASKQNMHLFAICGLQPEEVENFKDSLEDFIPLFLDEKCIAVGEIGLDYYYGKENKDQQLYYFEQQILMAIKVKKPIVIHCREAHEDTYNLLSKYAPLLDGIILHCYTGSVEMMQRYLKLGAYISISGIVTFKNAKVVKEVVKNCPLDRLLVETDDPYLAPTPHRGEKNYPYYVTYVVEEIAKIKDKSYEEIAKITSDNAKKVFHL